MLDDEMLGFGAFESSNELRPGQRAVADIGPAILVLVLACGRDVLDVHRGDARTELLDPGEGIGAAIDENDQSGNALGVRAFNKLAAGDPRLVATIVPVRDGLLVGLKTRDTP